MIVEGAVIGTGLYIYYRLNNKSYYRYRALIRQLPFKNTTFRNAEEEGIKFINFEEVGNINRLIVSITGIMGFEKLQEQKDYLLSYFNAKDINFKRLESGAIQIDIIAAILRSATFEIIPQQNYELLMGYDREGKAVLISANKFPHLLIGGDTGTGKSRFLLMLLSNLIANCKDIDLYLLQIRKSDLIVFKSCKQTKYIARSLEDTKELLKYLNDLCIYRDKLIEKYTISKGIYNIEDYNRYFKFNQIKYSYIVLDEFAFFSPTGADSKEAKELKRAILGYIKQIVLVGRSVGVFIITSLQKPTNSSIPSDIKSQLTARVCFKMLDKDTSIVILGNAKATEIEPRQAYIRTLGAEITNIPYIDHNLIARAIESHTEHNKKYIDLTQQKAKDSPQQPQRANNDGIISLEVLKNVINK